MKGPLSIKGDSDGSLEPVYCILDEQTSHLMFAHNEEDAMNSISYKVEKFNAIDAKTFSVVLSFEESTIPITFTSSSYSDTGLWVRAFNSAIKKNTSINIANKENNVSTIIGDISDSPLNVSSTSTDTAITAQTANTTSVDDTSFLSIDTHDDNHSVNQSHNDDQPASQPQPIQTNPAPTTSVTTVKPPVAQSAKTVAVPVVASTTATNNVLSPKVVSTKTSTTTITPAAAAAKPAAKPAVAPASAPIATSTTSAAAKKVQEVARTRADSGSKKIDFREPVIQRKTSSSLRKGSEDRSDSIYGDDGDEEKSDNNNGNLLKYGAIGGGVVLLLYMMFGDPFGRYSYYNGPAYMDPALMGRYGYNPYGDPLLAGQGGSSYSFTSSIFVICIGGGILFYARKTKQEADEPMVNEWQEEEEEEEETFDDEFDQFNSEPSILSAKFDEGPLGFSLVNDPTHGIVIGSAAAGGAAHKNKVQAGYKVLSVADTEILPHHKWDDVIDLIKMNPRPLMMTFQKNPNQALEASKSRNRKKSLNSIKRKNSNLNKAYDEEFEAKEQKKSLALKLFGGGGVVTFFGLYMLYSWMFYYESPFLQPRHISYVRETGSQSSSFIYFIVILLLLILIGLISFMIFTSFNKKSDAPAQSVSIDDAVASSAPSRYAQNNRYEDFDGGIQRNVNVASRNRASSHANTSSRNEPVVPTSNARVRAQTEIVNESIPASTIIKEKNQAIASSKTITIPNPVQSTTVSVATNSPKAVPKSAFSPAQPTVPAKATTPVTTAPVAAKPTATAASNVVKTVTPIAPAATTTKPAAPASSTTPATPTASSTVTTTLTPSADALVKNASSNPTTPAVPPKPATPVTTTESKPTLTAATPVVPPKPSTPILATKSSEESVSSTSSETPSAPPKPVVPPKPATALATPAVPPKPVTTTPPVPPKPQPTATTTTTVPSEAPVAESSLPAESTSSTASTASAETSKPATPIPSVPPRPASAASTPKAANPNAPSEIKITSPTIPPKPSLSVAKESPKSESTVASPSINVTEATTGAVQKHPLDQLKDKEFIKKENIPIGNLEMYLDDEDFSNSFKMSREEFEKLAKWKKDEMKKKVGLF